MGALWFVSSSFDEQLGESRKKCNNPDLHGAKRSVPYLVIPEKVRNGCGIF
jgi:hypothetical protein